MDRNVVIATVLIAAIMFVWLYFLAPSPPAEPPSEVATEDTSAVPPQPAAEEPLPLPETPSLTEVETSGADTTYAHLRSGTERFITVDSDLYRATFSTKGGTLVSFELKEYKLFDQKTPVQLVDDDADGALGLVFTTPSSHVEDTRSFFFEPSFEGDTLRVGEDGATLAFEAPVDGGLIRLTYSFTLGEYEVDMNVLQQNAASFSTDEGYEFVWNGGLPFTESPDNRQREEASFGASARSGGEVESITLLREPSAELTLRGDVSWVSVKNKYFVAVVMPGTTPREAELVGEKTGDAEAGTIKETYRASLLMPPASTEADTYRLYIGPLEFYRITKYRLGLYGMVDYGWDAFEWVTRPLAKFVFIPTFTFLSSFIPSYGIVIIIFALLIKLLVYPLTKSSYKSMARMRELQPRMQEIKEKYADDPQKQQEATMKMYKETGVNPLGGCLPMVLQYPIIIALWQFLQQSIEIRQQGFLWANDLSAPDVLLHLPFSIPFYGNYIAGFTLLMGLSLIVQMRIQSTPAAGAQAKIMQYVMPVFLFVIFNRLPSGLSLYYLCYNVVTAVQQKHINNSLERDKAKGGTNGKAGKKDSRAAGRVRKPPRKGGGKVRSKKK